MCPPRSHHRIWLAVALVSATLLRLYLAATTDGTTDIDGFVEQLVNVQKLGVSAYRVRGFFNNPFNHPPPMIYVLKGLGFVTHESGLPFKFWLRLLPTLADIGSFFMVWRLLGNRKDRFPLMIALTLCPISIMVDGYHGNTDGIMIMFVLLAVYLVESRAASWLVGLAFGFACCVKIAPLMLLPAFVLCLPDLKKRTQFAITVAVVFLVASSPYIFQDPMAIRKAVFDYQPVYGIWGIPRLLVMFYPVPPDYLNQPYDPIGIHGAFATVLKYINIAAMCVVTIWMNRKLERPRLFIQCGVVIAVCLFLTSGFGLQYLVWLVPFVVGLNLRTALIFYIGGSIYLILKYCGIDLSSNKTAVLISALSSFAAWYTVRIVLAHYYAALRLSVRVGS